MPLAGSPPSEKEPVPTWLVVVTDGLPPRLTATPPRGVLAEFTTSPAKDPAVPTLKLLVLSAEPTPLDVT